MPDDDEGVLSDGQDQQGDFKVHKVSVADAAGAGIAGHADDEGRLAADELRLLRLRQQDWLLF